MSSTYIIMILYGKCPKPLYGTLDIDLSNEPIYDGMSQQEWLKWSAAQGEQKLILAYDLQKRKQANNDFTNVPRYLSMIKHKMLCATKKLILADIIGFQQQGQKYYRSNRGIADIFGLSEAVVRDHLRNLEKMQLITKVEHRRSDGNSVRYILVKLKDLQGLWKS